MRRNTTCDKTYRLAQEPFGSKGKPETIPLDAYCKRILSEVKQQARWGHGLSLSQPGSSYRTRPDLPRIHLLTPVEPEMHPFASPYAPPRTPNWTIVIVLDD